MAFMNEGARVIAVIAVLFFGFMIPVKEAGAGDALHPREKKDESSRLSRADEHISVHKNFYMIVKTQNKPLPIREAADHKSKQIGAAPSGSRVMVLSTGYNPGHMDGLYFSWYRVRYNGKEGFACGKWLQAEMIPL